MIKFHKYPHHKLSLGEKAADAISVFAGSWTFLFLFFLFLFSWMLLNVYALFYWDPFPFILLNLILSTLAAVQAPVILMSQNRAAQRDRLQAKYDYDVNRKAEREIENMQKDLDEIKEMVRRLQ